MSEWLKWSGGISVFLASTLIGFYRSRLLERRVKWILSTMHALQRLETEIAFKGTPLKEALEEISRSRREARKMPDFFSELQHRLADARDDLRDVWQQATLALQSSGSLRAQELDVLRHLGQTLGLSDRDDQVRHLRLAGTQLQETLDLARHEQDKYQSMWRSFGMLGGALMVILLY